MAQPEQKLDDLELSRKNVEAAKADKSGKVFRVYSDGIFDLFHIGHMKMLEQAKKALGAERTYLIVGVCSDEDTQRYKGKTVLPHQVRCDSCANCKWVDEVAPDAPWVITDAFLDKYRIDFVAHDALPYVDASGVSPDGDVYGPIKKRGMFLETKRTEGISTSDIIAAIVKDYDELIERNLHRGFTKEQLNVGRTWEIRQVAHEKERLIRQALFATKRDWKDLTETARAFLHEFRPEGFRRSRRQYVQKLGEELPERAEGLLHQAFDLAASMAHLGLYCISFLNPIAYCRKPKRGAKKAS